MTDPADITDDPRELAEQLRRVAPKAPSHLQGKLYEAADALARLAPEPRQWQPGDWFEYDSGHDDSLAMVFAIHPLGDVIAVGWDGDRGDWNPGWFAHDPDTDGGLCDPPVSWVEAGRPGAIDQPARPVGTPSGIWKCETHDIPWFDQFTDPTDPTNTWAHGGSQAICGTPDKIGHAKCVWVERECHDR